MCNEALRGDAGWRDAALRSGGHIISTDYPAPVEGIDFILEFPGLPWDRAARRKPVNAPTECRDDALEP